MTIPPNTTLGHYTIISKIGAGGMGEVYRARDVRLDREVAIKILPQSYSSDVLTVFDIGTYEGSPFIVSELLAGDELRDQLKHGPLEERTDLSEINEKINPALLKIVRRCLEKNPDRRFQSASDLGFAIEASTSFLPHHNRRHKSAPHLLFPVRTGVVGP
jgi:serine/threonine protein kinase